MNEAEPVSAMLRGREVISKNEAYCVMAMPPRSAQAASSRLGYVGRKEGKAECIFRQVVDYLIERLIRKRMFSIALNDDECDARKVKSMFCCW